MNSKDIISALEALVEEARLAERTIQHTSAFDALQKRVWRLEQELEELKRKFDEV